MSENTTLPKLSKASSEVMDIADRIHAITDANDTISSINTEIDNATNAQVFLNKNTLVDLRNHSLTTVTPKHALIR